MLAVVRRLEKRGKHETAHRTKQRCGQVFRYAIATGRATRDVSADLRGALAPVVTKNHAAIVEPRRTGGLLRAIDTYVGHPPTQAALKLAPLVFLRPGELRKAEWSEIDRCNRRKRDYYVLGEEFIDPYADDVEDLVRHFGPLPSWKPGHARAETSLKILESGHPDRMPLVLRKIEKINQFDDLAERYLAENNPVLKAVLLKQLQHMRTLGSEYSAMLVEVGKQKGLPP